MKYFLFIIFLVPNVFFGQHSIKGKFSPEGEFKLALLYKVEPTHSSYITSAPIESDGNFEIKLDSTITKGVYRITYAVPQEEYNFDLIYNAEEDVELNFNLETGVEFINSRENKLLESYTNSMLMVTNSIGSYYKDKNKAKDTLALKSIFQTQREAQERYEAAAKGTLASHFIKANTPYTPENAIDVNAYLAKVKAHFFDYIDFKSPVLQRSKFLTERILNYVFGMSSLNKDEVTTYKENIAVFYKKMEAAPDEIKKALLVDFWEQMVDLKLESVANFITEDYLADLCVKLNDQQLLSVLLAFQNIALGNVAPDFSFNIEKGSKVEQQKLSTLNTSKTYIIAFWSSTCSHCLKEIPELHKLIAPIKTKDLQVIAIGLEKEVYNWNTLKFDFPKFIHVYGEGKWENPISNAYNVTATPTYFVLDENKRIINKPEDFEALELFLESHIKQ